MTIYYVNIKSPFVSVDPAVVGKSFSLYVVYGKHRPLLLSQSAFYVNLYRAIIGPSG